MHPAAPHVADRWSTRVAALELLGWIVVVVASATLFLSYLVAMPVWLPIAACVVGLVAALAVGRAAWRAS